MPGRLVCFGALCIACLAAPAASAQNCYVPYIPKAPDACGPGSYGPNWNGLYYGPNYCVYPPFPPFNGMLPVPQMGSGIPCLAGMPTPRPGMPFQQMPPTFPTHPFARSPRDFYMY